LSTQDIYYWHDYIQGGPNKTGLFSRSRNFATTNYRKARNMSRVWNV